MRKEPEIVTILREEERLRKLQMKSSDSFDNIEISEDASIDTSNDTIMLGVISKDITNNKKAEQLLVENEKIYRTLFEFFPQTLLLIDKNGTILDVNEQIKEWLGYKPNEILGTNIFSCTVFNKKIKKNCEKEFFG